MTDEDWQVLAWCLREIGAGRWSEPWVLTFEYGRVGPDAAEPSQPEVLKQQVPRLHDMLSGSMNCGSEIEPTGADSLHRE